MLRMKFLRGGCDVNPSVFIIIMSEDQTAGPVTSRTGRGLRPLVNTHTHIRALGLLIDAQPNNRRLTIVARQ